jgi:hypothetical protein
MTVISDQKRQRMPEIDLFGTRDPYTATRQQEHT